MTRRDEAVWDGNERGGGTEGWETLNMVDGEGWALRETRDIEKVRNGSGVVDVARLVDLLIGRNKLASGNPGGQVYVCE